MLLCLHVKGAEAGSGPGAAASQVAATPSSGTLSLERGRDIRPPWQGKDDWLPFSPRGARTQLNTSLESQTTTCVRPGCPTSDRRTLLEQISLPGEEVGPVRSAGAWALGKEVQTDKENGLGAEQDTLYPTSPKPPGKEAGEEGQQN